MPPTLESIEGLVKDLAANNKSLKDAQDALLAKLADDGDLMKAPAALRQLEQQFADISKSIDEKLAKIRRTSWDENGRYRGVFGSEDEARGFGLFCLSLQAGWDTDAAATAKAAGEILRRDYPDIAKAMDSVGDGALVAPEFSTRLQRLVESHGVFESEAFIMPMQSDSLTFMRRRSGVTVFRIGQNTAGTESKPTHDNVTLAIPGDGDGVLVYVPKSLDADAAVAIGELIATEIAQAYSEFYDNAGFNGDSSSTYLGYLGLIPKLSKINGVDDGGGLVLAAGNAWSEITIGDMDKLMGALPTYVTDPRYFCSRPFFAQVLCRLMHAAGGVTAAEIQGKRQLVFNGDPVRLVQKMPKSEGNSQIPVLYGSIRQAATMGRRQELGIETSRDYKFAERQITYLAQRRVAINCHDVGTDTEAGPIVGLITKAS